MSDRPGRQHSQFEGHCAHTTDTSLRNTVNGRQPGERVANSTYHQELVAIVRDYNHRNPQLNATGPRRFQPKQRARDRRLSYPDDDSSSTDEEQHPEAIRRRVAVPATPIAPRETVPVPSARTIFVDSGD